MAALTTQVITRAGLTPSFTAANSSETCATGETTFLVVKTGGTGTTVTLTTPGTVEGQAIADVAVTLSTNTEKWIGPITRNFFGDPATTPAYRCNIGYSSVTTVTAAVISL